SVRFSYLDKEAKRTTRTADPYGFIINAGRVYCVAYDHRRRDMRTFAVDSVSKPDVLPRTFVRPNAFNIEAYAAASISGVLHADRTTGVRVLFSPRVAKAAVAAHVVADRAVEHREDGSVEITYGVADVDELVRWVLGWGTQAEVLAPTHARRRIAELAGKIAAKY
ncbi:MAG: WYL domain-containing protein, partial [Candidatus Eremiobacteraeota bacterium]|nr:WYL domain-containing protein [Candidatus Eremiobacteraeota bacterium]